MDGKCLLRDLVYKATVTADQVPAMEYIGLCATEFRARYNNHTAAFRNENSGQKTTLSTYFWKMKNEGRNPSVTFKILKFAPSFTPEAGRCALCTAEKLIILKSEKNKTINSRTEILSTCRHRRRHILAHQKRLR